MSDHKTGYYCWTGVERSWHRTYDAASRLVQVARSQGLPAQVDCCACGERVFNACSCYTDQD